MDKAWSIETLTELDLLLRDGVAPDLSVSISDSGSLSKAEVIRHWCLEMRKEDGQARKLALRMVQSEQWLRIGFLLCAFVLGASAAKGLLIYDGRRLINVGVFLGILVFGQLLFLVLMLGVGLLTRRNPGGPYRRLLYHFTGKIPLKRSWPLWKLKTFQSVQLAGAAFNCGVLGTTLLHGITRDLAFGWATTLRIDAERIERIVHTVSRIWGGALSPDADQIRGSRINLQEGFQFVDPDSAAAWWPFLILCVIFYGILPRVLLITGSGLLLRHRCKHFRFNDPATEQLWLSLTRERIEITPPESGDAISSAVLPGTLRPFKPTGRMYLQMPPELVHLEKQVREHLSRLLSTPVEKFKPECSASESSNHQVGLIQLKESWQPPLEETRAHLRKLREDIGPETPIVICLAGFPTDSSKIFEVPDPQDVAVWTDVLQSVEDPYLHAILWQPAEDPGAESAPSC